MKLSSDMIIAAAISLLQDEGLDAVSLRRLAARLDARAPSLARHVGDKDNLLALMSSSLFRETFDAIAPTTDWQEWAVSFGQALWRSHNQMRDAAKLIALAPSNPELFGATLKAFEAQFARLNLSYEQGMLLQSSVQAFVTGWSTLATASKKKDDFAAHIPIERTVQAGLRALVGGLAKELETLRP
jgi:TetR/AcrR family transcriptional regulator, tetracycline repressor protein